MAAATTDTNRPPCSVEGCDRTALVKSRALCQRHYHRFRRHGDPEGGGTYSHTPIVERLTSNIRVADIGFKDLGPCWNWAAAKNANGYGIMGVGTKVMLAHRVSYMEHVGEIPEGLELDHLCRNRGCVNPAHLEAVTRSENVRRGWPTRRPRTPRTHCSEGHAMVGDNVIHEKRNARRCRICRDAYNHRAYLARKRAA